MAAEKLLEMARDQQAQEVAEAVQLEQQRAQAADIRPNQLGNQFLPGQAQLQRPGEAGVQRQRVGEGTQQERTFPRGMGGLDVLGSQLGTATGGGRNMPTGDRA